MTLRILSVLSIALALTACSATPKGKFQCPTPNGVACMGMDELYKATNDSDRVVGRARGTESRSGESDGVEEAPIVFRADTRRAGTNYIQPQVPVRSPAKVMRIWMAPWQDDQGDLVMASYVYSEIEGRKWAVGETPRDTVRSGTYTYRLESPSNEDTNAVPQPGAR